MVSKSGFGPIETSIRRNREMAGDGKDIYGSVPSTLRDLVTLTVVFHVRPSRKRTLMTHLCIFVCMYINEILMENK